jgi:lipoyl(octanoyl) transferase
VIWKSGSFARWLNSTCAASGVRGASAYGSRAGKVALGIRVRRGVSYHGVSFNVDPELENFSGIVPCGIAEHGVTSLADLGLTATMADVDIALRAAFEGVFGATCTASA